MSADDGMINDEDEFGGEGKEQARPSIIYITFGIDAVR